MRNKLASLIAVLVLTLTCTLASGQATGLPPFNSFSNAGGGIDTINLANLNVHMEVPLRSLGAYGPLASVALVLDSLASESGSSTNPPSPFALNKSTDGLASILSISGSGCSTVSTAQNLTDRSNTVHHTPILTVTGCNAAVSTLPGNDGWSLAAKTDSAGTATFYVVAPNGEVTYSSGAGTSVLTTDAHGNSVTYSSGTMTDALGNVVLQGLSSPPSSTVYLTYPGPNSTTSTYTLTYTNPIVKAYFGCAGLTATAANKWLLASISFPDKSTMGFTYEPMNNTAITTGRIASVTLRTGALIKYDYTGYGTNGVNCSDASTAGFKKTTPDGIWKFSHSAPSGTNQLSTTTVTGPDAFVNTYTFSGLYPVAESNTFTGFTICYKGNVTNCSNPPSTPTLPITERDVYSYVTGVTSPSLKAYLYDGYSRLTDAKTYDFGGVRNGSNFVTDEAVSYGTWNGSTCVVQNESVQGVSVPITGVVCARGVYTPGLANPVSFTRNSYAANTADLTLQQNLIGGAWQPTTITYDSLGRVTSTSGPNGESNTVSYSQCSGNMPYQYSYKASGATTLYEAVTVTDCVGEVAETIYDFNNQYTSIDYNTDPFWRPTSVKDQAGTVTTFTYTSPTSTTISTPIASGSVKEFVETLDSMGRGHVVQQRLGSSSTQYSSVETDYDANGRVSRVTTPYQAALGGTNSSVTSTTRSYDGLNRPTSIASPIGAVSSFTYTASGSARDTLVALNSGPNGERKQTQYEYNGLGRVTSVCEVTSMAGSYSCGQANAKNGFLTSYVYSGPGNLMYIYQNVGGTIPTQVRWFGYENGNTGRLLTATTPESGTLSFTYDSDGTCGTFIGAVVKTVDNGGGTTCIHYDLLGRVTSKNYSGLNVGNTPSRTFIYDATSNANIKCPPISNNGRLVEVITTDPLVGTDEGFCYDVVGNPTDTYTWIYGSVWDHASESYFPTGIPQTLVLGTQQSISYGLDSMARIYSATASAGQNPLTSVTYNIANQPTVVTLGSGDSSTYNWSFPSGPLSSSSFTVGASTVSNTLTWNSNGTLQKLAVTDPLNAANTQTCSYAYDDLSRLTADNCGAGWSQTFGYDLFGNVTKSANPGTTWQPGYNQSNNRYLLAGTAYDANGRLTNDTFDTMSWDIEGNMVGQSGATHAYDGLNRPAGEAGPTFTNYIYAPDGRLLARADGNGNLQKMYFPLPMSSAVYGASTLSHYRRYDFQGSMRVASTPTKTKYSDTAYGAFGESYGTTGTSNAQYAGLTSDISSGIEQVSASRRYHPTQGRWVSPDRSIPNLFNPQTFNAYHYASNQPTNKIDPSGASDISDGGSALIGDAFGVYVLGTDPMHPDLSGMPPAGMCGDAANPVDCSTAPPVPNGPGLVYEGIGLGNVPNCSWQSITNIDDLRAVYSNTPGLLKQQEMRSIQENMGIAAMTAPGGIFRENLGGVGGPNGGVSSIESYIAAWVKARQYGGGMLQSGETGVMSAAGEPLPPSQWSVSRSPAGQSYVGTGGFSGDNVGAGGDVNPAQLLGLHRGVDPTFFQHTMDFIDANWFRWFHP